jgi:uncharacterized integral membrane protein
MTDSRDAGPPSKEWPERPPQQAQPDQSGPPTGARPQGPPAPGSYQQNSPGQGGYQPGAPGQGDYRQGPPSQGSLQQGSLQQGATSQPARPGTQPIQPQSPQPSTQYQRPAGPETPPTPIEPPPGFDDRGHVRRTKVSGVWVGLIAAVVVLVLLIIFIAQNLDKATVHFLGFSGRVSLGLALLVAALCGVVIAVVPGTVRIFQLRKALRANADTDALRNRGNKGKKKR